MTQVETLEKEGAELSARLAEVAVMEAQIRGESQIQLQRQLAKAEKKLTALKVQHPAEADPHEPSTSHQTGDDNMVVCLQEELVKVRLCEAENEATIRELKNRINELEQDKKTLHESVVDNSVAHLQEELIAVKLREAEANLSLKELKQRVAELSEMWMKHLQEHRQENRSHTNTGVLSTPKKIMRAWENRTVDTQRLEEELMTSRIRETETRTELKDLQLKVMELESQVQVSTNQLRRQDDEKKVLKDELEASQRKIRDLLNKQKEKEQKYIDLSSKNDYEQMLSNIRFAEDSQKIAALEHEISVLQMRNQISIAEGKLKTNEENIENCQQFNDKNE